MTPLEYKKKVFFPELKKGTRQTIEKTRSACKSKKLQHFVSK
jgi:hypothetical protein